LVTLGLIHNIQRVRNHGGLKLFCDDYVSLTISQSLKLKYIIHTIFM